MVPRPAATGRPPFSARVAGLGASTIAALMFLTLRLLENVLFGGEPFEMNGGAGNQIYQVTLVAVCGAVWLAARPWEDVRRLLVLPASVTAMLAWCWLSIAWSLAPDITVRRIAQLSMVIFTTFVIVRQLGYERTLTVLRWTFLITIALCYVFVVADPTTGIQTAHNQIDPDGAGSWRGVFIDKNVCGAFCASTICLFVFDARNVRIPVRAAAIVLTLFFLVMSASKTALGVLVIALAVGAVLTRYDSRMRPLLVPGLLGTAVVAVLGWHLVADPFRNALYDTSAFTGRGPIWLTLLRYLHDHWLLGAGFSAFWAVPDSPVFQYADADWVRDTVRIGHNGYLDLLATIGVPGLLLTMVATIVLPMARLLTSNGVPPGRIALLASIIVFFLGQNLTESSFLHEKSFITIILMFTVALSAAAIRRSRPGAAAPNPARTPRFRNALGPRAMPSSD